MKALLQFLASILKGRINAQDDYANSMRRALARKPLLNADGRYLLARKFMTATVFAERVRAT